MRVLYSDHLRMARTEEEKRIAAREASRRSYAKHAEKNRQRTARWRAENPERVVAYRQSEAGKAVQARSAKKWHDKNPDYLRNWEEANRERRREQRKEAYHADPEKYRKKALNHLNKPGVREAVANRAREAKKRPEVRERIRINKQNRRALVGNGRLSRGITKKLIDLQRGKCAGCKGDLEKLGHHLDHIVPLALGGEHADQNIQLLCPPCNRLKNAKHPVDWAQENGRLL